MLSSSQNDIESNPNLPVILLGDGTEAGAGLFLLKGIFVGCQTFLDVVGDGGLGAAVLGVGAHA